MPPLGSAKGANIARCFVISGLALVGCQGLRTSEHYCAEWQGSGALDWGRPSGGSTVCVDDECYVANKPICLRWVPVETVDPPRDSDAGRIVGEAIRKERREEESHNAIYKVIQQSSDEDRIFEEAIRKEIKEIESQNAREQH